MLFVIGLVVSMLRLWNCSVGFVLKYLLLRLWLLMIVIWLLVIIVLLCIWCVKLLICVKKLVVCLIMLCCDVLNGLNMWILMFWCVFSVVIMWLILLKFRLLISICMCML